MGDRGRLLEVTALFLRLGATSFGGPAAYIAVMEDEVVSRRRWLERRDFLDLLGAAQLLPGPNATELAIHLGYRRAGARWVDAWSIEPAGGRTRRPAPKEGAGAASPEKAPEPAGAR